jgi:hypothetical protein
MGEQQRLQRSVGMKKALRMLLAVLVVIGLPVFIRGRMIVAEVRHQEAQLQQVIEDLALPGTVFARPPDPIPEDHIWTGWLLKPIPLIGTLVQFVWYPNGLRWRPDQSIHMGAVYRSDEPPAALHARYLEHMQPIQNRPLLDDGYFLSTRRSDIAVLITITPREFLPDGNIYGPSPGAAPETLATAVEISVFPQTAAEAEQFRAYP